MGQKLPVAHGWICMSTNKKVIFHELSILVSYSIVPVDLQCSRHLSVSVQIHNQMSVLNRSITKENRHYIIVGIMISFLKSS